MIVVCIHRRCRSSPRTAENTPRFQRNNPGGFAAANDQQHAEGRRRPGQILWDRAGKPSRAPEAVYQAANRQSPDDRPGSARQGPEDEANSGIGDALSGAASARQPLLSMPGGIRFHERAGAESGAGSRMVVGVQGQGGAAFSQAAWRCFCGESSGGEPLRAKRAVARFSPCQALRRHPSWMMVQARNYGSAALRIL